MSHTTLISADTLRALMAGPQAPLLFDTSFDLVDTDAGRRGFAQAHLPGARYLHLEDDLSGVRTAPDGRFRGRHPLPERADFAARAGRLGIEPGVQVVGYDRQGGMGSSRLWWMLRWIGHETVAVLDGGVDAWLAAGGSLTTETPAPSPAAAPYPLRDGLASRVDATELAARLGRHPLIDARAGERFRGEVEPLDAQGGHIPGALNRFFKDNLDARGQFKPAAQLRAEFEALVGVEDIGEVVHQCGSGVTACHNLLAMEHAGLAGSRLYPGSWSEWSSDPSRPIARG